jgi:hypothetical protein
VALGLFEHSTFSAAETRLEPSDLLVLYSDGITEAEDPSGHPLEESGLELVVERHASEWVSAIATAVITAVETHARRPRFGDDLTILVIKREFTVEPDFALRASSWQASSPFGLRRGKPRPSGFVAASPCPSGFVAASPAALRASSRQADAGFVAAGRAAAVRP